MIEKILEVDRDVEIESLLARNRGAATLWSGTDGGNPGATATAGHGWTTWAPWTATTRSPVRGHAGCWSLPRRSCLGSSITLVNKGKRAADAQVDDKRSRSLAKVTRNDRFTRQRHEIEVTKTCATDRRCRAVCIGSGKARTFVYLPVEIEILARRDIKTWSSVGDDKWIQYNLPPRQVNGAEDRKPMSNVKRAASKLSRRIVGIHREKHAALAIGVVRGLAQRIVTVECKHPTKPAIEADEELSLVELPTCLVTIDFALGRIGPNSVRRQRRNRRGERCVDIARANHVHDANVIEAGEHGYVPRQLSFYLRSHDEDC